MLKEPECDKEREIQRRKENGEEEQGESFMLIRGTKRRTSVIEGREGEKKEKWEGGRA